MNTENASNDASIAFARADAVLTPPTDLRLGRVSDAACFRCQDEDGPVYLAIAHDATDEQLARAATRFKLDIAELEAFRSHQDKTAP